ncbi:MAG: TetR/AcrR family transcriptional regulator [Acidimicrobiales bacterium]
MPNEGGGDARADILAAAAALFERDGYTSTSTRTIALAVGLRQASLFHYFARKEEILTDLLDQTVRSTLDFARRHSLGSLDADVALWLLTREDVANLCRGPHNLGALQLLPEVRSPQFAWFWRRRRQLFKEYMDHIARGMAGNFFAPGELGSASDLVFGLVESVITGRPQMRRRASTPSDIADGALRLCGVRAARIRSMPAHLRRLETPPHT